MARQEYQNVSRETKAMVLFQPHMIGLAFSLDHYKASSHQSARIANDPGMIAMTDGRTVWYGEKFEKIEQPGRNYIFLHELLHGVLRHGTRTKLIQLTKGFVFPVLANYAADANINEGISADAALKNAQFEMPKDFPGITMKTIHEIIQEAAKFSGEKPLETYDPKAIYGLQMERIYDWLVWAHEAVQRKRKEMQKEGNPSPGSPSRNATGSNQSGKGKGKGHPEDQEPETPVPGDQEDGEGNQPTNNTPEPPSDETRIERILRTEEAWDLAEAADEIRRLLESGVSATDLINQANEEVDKARSHIQAIIQGLKMQGVGKGNVLLALENDLPDPVIPWNMVIRKTITRDLGTNMTDSYAKLGVSTRAALAMGRPAPYQPGMTIFTERPRVLVVLDVSGSHLSEINQCFAEIWSIVCMKNAAVDVVTFDDGVQQKMEIKRKVDFKRILDQGITGGGGTDLGDVFDEIKNMRTPYRLAIIMTDGYLSPPRNTNGLNLMWVITPGGTTGNLHESGQVIEMPVYMGGQARKTR